MGVSIDYMSRRMSHVSELLRKLGGCEKVDPGLSVIRRNDDREELTVMCNSFHQITFSTLNLRGRARANF